MYLEHINGPADVKKLNIEELGMLADEMRQALLKKLSKTGGHFGPNFAVVELTAALHYVFDSPKDKIVFDVAHQCYSHKMLTGRKEAYLFEEHYHDVSGFTNQDESEHDFFRIGHTSTSVSLACGLAKARDMKGAKENIIAVIGDGSLSGGEALEGLDFAGEMKTNLIIVVNDNEMSIAENHGGIYKNLKLLRDSAGTAELNLFKAMGLEYMYVEEGHDVKALVEAFEKVKDSDKPVVVHVHTVKGKGHKPAEENKEGWHYNAPFDLEVGYPVPKGTSNENYADLTADYLIEKMKNDKDVVAITSGTPGIIGFGPEKRAVCGEQFIDVGIAEEHAVALASGMAANGGKPVYGVCSTFMQRSFDQLSQDLCLNKNPATILVFGASVYGMHDATHIGIFDIPMISHIPNLVYLAPTNKEEYLAMLDYAIEQKEHPVAIRVPGGNVVSTGMPCEKDFGRLNEYEVAIPGRGIAIIALGGFFGIGLELTKIISDETGHLPTLINPCYITGLDEEVLNELKRSHKVVITMEDGILEGGFGQKIASFYGDSDMKVLNYGLRAEFIDRYNNGEVLKENRLDAKLIFDDIAEVMERVSRSNPCSTCKSCSTDK